MLAALLLARVLRCVLRNHWIEQRRARHVPVKREASSRSPVLWALLVTCSRRSYGSLAVVENSADTDAVPTYPGCLPAPEYLRDLRDYRMIFSLDARSRIPDRAPETNVCRVNDGTGRGACAAFVEARVPTLP